jgi:hypothetical protein
MVELGRRAGLAVDKPRLAGAFCSLATSPKLRKGATAACIVQVSRVRTNSEAAMKQEVAWATHLGLPAILMPTPSYDCANYARVANQLLQARRIRCRSTQHGRIATSVEHSFVLQLAGHQPSAAIRL